MGEAVPTEQSPDRPTEATKPSRLSAVSGLLLALGVIVIAAAGAFLLGSGADAAPTCTKNFTGPTGGAWETPGNWSPAGVPTTSDYACSTAAKSIVLSSGLQSVDGVQLLGSLTAQGGELHTGASASSFASLTLAGGTVSGSASITGSFAWQGGGFSGAGTTTLAPGSVSTIDTDSYNHVVQGGHVLANQGSMTWTYGYMSVCDGATLQNSGTFTLDSTGGFDIGHFYGCTNQTPGSLTNTGTMAATAGNQALGSTRPSRRCPVRSTVPAPSASPPVPRSWVP